MVRLVVRGEAASSPAWQQLLADARHLRAEERGEIERAHQRCYSR
jgi:hypothetical protein